MKKIDGILLNMGFDGIIYSGKKYGNEYIAVNSNQIKLVENKNPTESRDIRYSLSEKNYTKKEAEKVINNIMPEIAVGEAADEYEQTFRLEGKQKLIAEIVCGVFNLNGNRQHLLHFALPVFCFRN